MSLALNSLQKHFIHNRVFYASLRAFKGALFHAFALSVLAAKFISLPLFQLSLSGSVELVEKQALNSFGFC